jgi:GNAT superfamily N-acetyltransferase
VDALVDVVEIGPDRVEDYLALFDRAFHDNPDWGGCYCAFYDTPPGQPFDTDADGPRHREQRRARIASGSARGLLAYRDGVAVGWCNVAPRSEVANLRKFAEAIEDPADQPAVIMCFVIDPDHRGAGVASALLRGAIEVSRRWGAAWLEGYPTNPDSDLDGLPSSAAFYKGPLRMYLNAGFTISREIGSWYVVRHDLYAG